MTSLRGHKRKEFPQAVRKTAFARCCQPDGIPKCESCGNMIRGTPVYEHVQPDGLGGDNTIENCKVHCRVCADNKTFKDDNPRMAKADRVLKKTYGLQAPRKRIQSRGFAKAPPQRTASRPLRRST